MDWLKSVGGSPGMSVGMTTSADIGEYSEGCFPVHVIRAVQIKNRREVPIEIWFRNGTELDFIPTKKQVLEWSK